MTTQIMAADSSRNNLFSKIFGKQRAPQKVIAPVIYNKIKLGKAMLGMNPDNSLHYIVANDLLPILKSQVDDEYFQMLSDLQQQAKLEVSKLNAAGLETSFDAALLELHISFPLEHARIRSINYGIQNPVWNGQLTEAENFSGYLNYLASSRWQQQTDHTSSRNYSLKLEPVLNVHSLVFETNLQLENSRETSYGSSFVTLDDERNAIRYRLGEVTPPTTGFQASPPLAGISIAREFGIHPYENIKPGNTRKFILQERSTVTIYVNNRKFDQQILEAGKYSIGDLGLAEGSNNIRLEIDGFSGSRRQVNFDIAVSSLLLEESISDFAFSLGAPLKPGTDAHTYKSERKTMVGSGYYRRGLTPSWTLGGDGQFDENIWSLGLESVHATFAGNLAASQGISHFAGTGYGFRSKLQYDYFFENKNNTRLSLEWLHTSKQFTVIGSETAFNNDRSRYEFNLSSYLSGQLYGVFSGALLSNRVPDAERNIFLDTRLTKTWSRQIQSSLSLNASKDDLGKWQKGILLTLNLTFSHGSHNISSRFNSALHQQSTTWTRQPEKPLGGFQHSITLSRDQFTRSSTVDSRYRNSYLDTSLTFGAQRNSGDNNITTASAFQMGGAFAFNQHAAGFSRHINDSYAMVIKNDYLSGQRLGINPMKAGSDHAAYALDALPAVIPDYNSYRYSSLLVDSSTLDPGYSLERERYMLKPGYKSGQVIIVGQRPAVTLVGRLVDQTRKPLGLIVGELASVKQSPSRLKLFTNRKGKFVIEGISPGQYSIHLEGLNHAPMIIDVPDSAKGVYRINTINAEVYDDH